MKTKLKYRALDSWALIRGDITEERIRNLKREMLRSFAHVPGRQVRTYQRKMRAGGATIEALCIVCRAPITTPVAPVARPQIPWRFQVGERVRLTASDVTAPIYGPDPLFPATLDELLTDNGSIPEGAEGMVIQIDGGDQNHFNSQIICHMRWTEDPSHPRYARSAIIYLGGDSCLESVR